MEKENKLHWRIRVTISLIMMIFGVMLAIFSNSSKWETLGIAMFALSPFVIAPKIKPIKSFNN